MHFDRVREIATLRELRAEFGRGKQRPVVERSAEDDVQLAAFRTLDGLLRLIDEYGARRARGERCRLVEEELPSGHAEFRIAFMVVGTPR